MAHPEVVFWLALFSVVGALGQIFIYLTILHFSSLVCSMITTTRKFFTLLASLVWFGHTLSLLQWTAVAMVFTGLGMDTVSEYLRKSALDATKKSAHATNLQHADKRRKGE